MIKERLKELFGKKKITVSFRDNYINCGLPVIGLWCDKVKLNFLIDSGSTINAINEEAIKYLHYTDVNKHADVLHAGGKFAGKFISLQINDGKRMIDEEFMVMNLSEQFSTISQQEHVLLHGIVGCSFLERINGNLDFETFSLKYKI